MTESLTARASVLFFSAFCIYNMFGKPKFYINFKDSGPVGETELVRAILDRETAICKLDHIFQSKMWWGPKQRKLLQYLSRIKYNHSDQLESLAHVITRFYYATMNSDVVFLKSEQTLLRLRLRLNPLNSQQFMQFLASLKIHVKIYQCMDLDMIATVLSLKKNKPLCLTGPVYGINWKYIPMFVATKKVLVAGGIAYFNKALVEDIVVYLTLCMMTKKIKQIQVGVEFEKKKRLMDIGAQAMLWFRHGNLTGKINNNQLTGAKSMGSGEHCQKPPCIKAIIDAGKKTGHVGFKGRNMLAFWQRHIGCSKQEAEAFAKRLLHQEDENSLTNLYNNAWKKKMNSYGCQKIRTWGTVSNARMCHGCTMKDQIACTKLADLEDIVKSPADFTIRVSNPNLNKH